MRFMKEYCSYKKRQLTMNWLILKEFREQKIKDIDRVYNLYNRGLITTDEAMREIAEV